MFLFLLPTLLLGCTKELRVKETILDRDVPNPAEPTSEFYVIGPGDSLGIVVWKEPEASGTVKVRPDGFITLPLINEVQVSGLKTEQLRKILQEKYAAYINDPFVTVRVEDIKSNEIFLIGQVNKPGAYPALGNDTLLQLLTRAGGLTPFADRSDIRVVRRFGKKVTEFIIDYDAILDGDLSQDILLRPGDRIIAP